MRPRRTSGRARRRTHPADAAAVPPAVVRALSRPGQTLDAATRARFEPHFRTDFATVRIHADREAAAAAHSVGADALAFGPDIVFAAGRYAPDTVAGSALIAHELAHVVQAPERGAGPIALGAASDAAERQADGMAAAALSGATISTAGGAPGRGVVRRQLAGGTASTDESEAFAVSMANGLTLDAFASDSAELTDDHRRAIAGYKARITTLLQAWPDSFMSVVGHTDATDSEAHNALLGQQRAEAVMGALGTGDAALPMGLMRASSLGETALRVDTKGREPRNRRVEIHFVARRFYKQPPMTPSQPWRPPPKISVETPIPGIGRIPDETPQAPPKIPADKPQRRNWVEEQLKRDELIRELPKWAQDKVRDALADVDEVAADKVIGALPIGEKEKEALKAVAKSILQLLKGKKPNMQEPSPHQLPPSSAPKMPSAPGEKLFPIYEWKW